MVVNIVMSKGGGRKMTVNIVISKGSIKNLKHYFLAHVGVFVCCWLRQIKLGLFQSCFITEQDIQK